MLDEIFQQNTSTFAIAFGMYVNQLYVMKLINFSVENNFFLHRCDRDLALSFYLHHVEKLLHILLSIKSCKRLKNNYLYYYIV